MKSVRTLFAKRFLSISTLGLTALALAACASDDDGDGNGEAGDGDGDFGNLSCADIDGDCVEVATAAALQEAANSTSGDTTIIIAAGTFELDNQVTLRGPGITIAGQGMEETILDFAGAGQSNGVDAVGNDFWVHDLQIVDAKKDGLRVEDSDGVTIQKVRVTWSNPGLDTNGAYGIYPVKVQNVLIEDSEALRSSDAGIYVGQCQHAVVRNNRAAENVAGIEIENTQYADVYGNTAENNTGGLVVFDLPGNPVIGHDIWIHDNMIRDNNHPNFAAGGTVRQIPPGTGTFTLASRRVEISNNTYENNNVVDIAFLSGLAIESDPQVWGLSMSELVGDPDIAKLEVDVQGDMVFNHTSNDLYVHDNTHTGGGQDLSGIDPNTQDLGALLQLLYQWGTSGFMGTDAVFYDTIGESAFDPMDAGMNSNDNDICVKDAPSFVSVNLTAEVLAGQELRTLDGVFRPDAPFAPFDCDGVMSGPIEGLPTVD